MPQQIMLDNKSGTNDNRCQWQEEHFEMPQQSSVRQNSGTIITDVNDKKSILHAQAKAKFH